ncbi:phosphoribosyl-AMP cyclohydrolase [Nitrincola nitratireducens]|uniref:Phosphoribosyl-AMP cyclohydrolase n=1 Tax=Nitrincola nitratireducens TaxID=1229521 RepID=W9V9B9_9GAMM|nr:phosphoribosyl-AMP cyclohydrolase [Nitrincola nitratireducens]EXJ12672.1 phosphoribosyl-AMP cyclohydrolase [Nitrincola nitratireducens]
MTIWQTLEEADQSDSFPLEDILSAIPWNQDGLIAAIAQENDTKDMLMLAWMNKEALIETLSTRQVCYWSRSRQSLWRKGETSGHVQHLIDARFDCDGDALLLIVNQQGAACHTGRPNCFYNAIRGEQIVVTCSKPNNV